jgi:hypothetical protein
MVPLALLRKVDLPLFSVPFHRVGLPLALVLLHRGDLLMARVPLHKIPSDRLHRVGLPLALVPLHRGDLLMACVPLHKMVLRPTCHDQRAESQPTGIPPIPIHAQITGTRRLNVHRGKGKVAQIRNAPKMWEWVPRTRTLRLPALVTIIDPLLEANKDHTHHRPEAAATAMAMHHNVPQEREEQGQALMADNVQEAPMVRHAQIHRVVQVNVQGSAQRQRHHAQRHKSDEPQRSKRSQQGQSQYQLKRLSKT